MKRNSLTLSLVLTLLLAVLLTASAIAADGGWQIGTRDGAVNPIDGSAEFPATGAFSASYDYEVGSDADAVNSPSMPGYIGPDNVCAFANDGRPCTDTTAELNIQFSLACNPVADQLTYVYGRYGSENDTLLLNGEYLGTVDAGGENAFQEFEFSLPALSHGDHVLTIQYAGGGSGNGHYIDYVKLAADPACTHIDVGIDIKPNSYPNSFNINGHGVVPVAILGSATFDVTEIDTSTLDFAGLAVRVKGNGAPQCSVKDVSGANMPYGEPDGYDDLVCQFVDDASSWTAGDATATLSGNLYDGTPFSGSDTINIVP